MSQNKSRLIDKTFLSLDLAEERGLVHRDYIAHCHRWSHVTKFLNRGHAYKKAVVLDVGCGKEMPLAKLLYVNKMSPPWYVGVDANKMAIPDMLMGKKIPIKLWSETDFCELEPADVAQAGNAHEFHAPNIVTCYEVLEHVTPGHCRRMLQHMQKLTSPDVNLFISTPCWNGKAAQNHINEMTFPALGSLIEDLGFNIEGVWGTFASIRDYKDQLSGWTHYYAHDGRPLPESTRTTNLLPLFEVLSEYYDTNVLSTIFAPLFPAQSRNCLWHLTKGTEGYERRFSRLEFAPTPWTQHQDWKELDGCEVKVDQGVA